LSASKWEGIGVANLEAAAFGCLPFLSRIPPHEEIAETLQLTTYSLDDPSEWVDGIGCFLRKSDDERAQIRHIVSERARENFDLNTMVIRYLAVYRELTADAYRSKK
jgi:glycosyltransferase involved in cell wall biosynthesis